MNPLSATSPESPHTDAPASTILIVEDDQGVRESLAMVLEFQHHRVHQAATGEDGLRAAIDDPPDLVILDVNLPGIDGIETCRRLRFAAPELPILMLTARHEVADRVQGLDAGADDYLPKPFALEELLARIRVLLRGHAPHRSPSVLRLADLVSDPSARRVTRAGRMIDVTKLEFDLLRLLVANADVVLRREAIHDAIWGHDDDLGSNSLEVFVSALRRKTEVGDAPRLIHTVRGVGYVARARP